MTAIQKSLAEFLGTFWLVFGGCSSAVTNTSVNPARSTGPALNEGGIALSQLWIFWIAPIIGAILAGFAYKFVGGSGKDITGTEG